MKPKADLNDLRHVQAVEGAETLDYGVATHAVERESPVDIVLMVAPANYVGEPPKDRTFVRVKVWSKVKKNIFSYTDLHVPGHNRSEMHKRCCFAGAMLAERQIVMFGDAHEPSYMARKAGEHFNELCDHLEHAR